MAARLDTSSHCRGKRGRNLTCRFTTAWTRRHQHRIGRRARPTLTTANGTESAITVRRSGSLSEQKSSGVFTPKLESGPVQGWTRRSEEHTSELQSRLHLVCRLLLEKKKSFIRSSNLSKQHSSHVTSTPLTHS